VTLVNEKTELSQALIVREPLGREPEQSEANKPSRLTWCNQQYAAISLDAPLKSPFSLADIEIIDPRRPPC
jgi:hypothetical protein